MSRKRLNVEILADHLEFLKLGPDALNEDLQRNYSPDVVLLTSHGIYYGHTGVKLIHGILYRQLPEVKLSYRNILCEGDMALLEWTADSPRGEVLDGVDTYVIRNGRIVAQTIHYTVTKNKSLDNDNRDSRMKDVASWRSGPR